MKLKELELKLKELEVELAKLKAEKVVIIYQNSPCTQQHYPSQQYLSPHSPTQPQFPHNSPSIWCQSSIGNDYGKISNTSQTNPQSL